jgi:LPXTG-motif cell wall-anchored protein
MRRRVIGAALTVLGVLVLLFTPFEVATLCAFPGGCREQGSSSLWGWVDYPPGWGDKLAWPMLIIGLLLVVTGIVLLLKRRRSRGSPSPAW